MVIDGREGGVDEYRQVPRIKQLCQEYHTDGLMILTTSSVISGGPSVILSEAEGSPDFVMEFYNPDGSGGMMCGNGGRCIVAFADYLGLKPAAPDGTWHFLAPDGMHEAQILDRSNISEPSLRDPSHPDGWAPPSYTAEGGHGFGDITPIQKWIVRLKMIDVHGITPVLNGYFLNTGTRHYVQFVNDVDSIDMEEQAKPIRWAQEFQPEGANVNFVEVTSEGLKVRTFEKGVEGETLACGTGITASAIAACYAEIPDQVGNDGVPDGAFRHARPRPGISYRLQCRRGDWLSVEFQQDGQNYTEVYLTGPAEILP